MRREDKRKLNIFLRYLLLIALGIVMTYPLLWMFGASFKTNAELFSSASIIPYQPTLDGYRNGYKGYEGMTLFHFMGNTYKFVIPKVIVTVISATITAYGFARFQFVGKRIFFAILLSTLFLPQVVLNAPQYILFNEVGWLNSYLPIVIPSALAGDTFFVYMLIQFLRGIPRELEEAAVIDGCTPFMAFWRIVFPLLMPSISAVVILNGFGIWNNYSQAVFFLQSSAKHNVPQALSVYFQQFAGAKWNLMAATAVIAIVPVVVIFLIFQKSLMKGLTEGAIKG